MLFHCCCFNNYLIFSNFQKHLCRVPMSFGRTGQVSNIVLHDLRSFGFCFLNTPPHVKSSFIWAQNDYREITLSCPESPRLVFIFLQGGHHVELSSWYGITTFLDPIMNKLQSELSSCWERVKILFSGATVCSDEVVKKYPHQNRANVAEFNKNMATWLKEHHPRVESVDFFNLSAESVNSGRTADGFHSLTDVNLLKAVTVLNIMHRMALN